MTNKTEIISKLRMAQVSSCTCLTKTNEASYHEADCLYRVLSEAISAIATPVVERQCSEVDPQCSEQLRTQVLAPELAELQATIARLTVENERLQLPHYLKLSDEMRAAGNHAVSRAREDGCASSPVLDSVFFEAAIQRWLDDRDDQPEIERLKGGQGEPVLQAREIKGEPATWEDMDDFTFSVCCTDSHMYETRILYRQPFSQPAPVSASAEPANKEIAQ
jgi:hypothetical protein